MSSPICTCVTKAEILTLSAFTIVLVLTMAKICTISDESDTSGDQEDTKHIEASHSHLAVPQTSRGECVSRLGPVGSVQKHSPVSVSRIHKAYTSLDKNMPSVFVSKESRVREFPHTNSGTYNVYGICLIVFIIIECRRANGKK